MKKLDLDFTYKLVETDIRSGKQTIVKTFWGYAEAKKHLKEFYEFLLNEKIEIIENLKFRYNEVGYSTSEINTLINNDIKLPLMFNRNTAMLDGFYKYEIKKVN
jgi:hypothetical protein